MTSSRITGFLAGFGAVVVLFVWLHGSLIDNTTAAPSEEPTMVEQPQPEHRRVEMHVVRRPAKPAVGPKQEAKQAKGLTILPPLDLSLPSNTEDFLRSLERAGGLAVVIGNRQIEGRLAPGPVLISGEVNLSGFNLQRGMRATVNDAAIRDLIPLGGSLWYLLPPAAEARLLAALSEPSLTNPEDVRALRGRFAVSGGRLLVHVEELVLPNGSIRMDRTVNLGGA